GVRFGRDVGDVRFKKTLARYRRGLGRDRLRGPDLVVRQATLGNRLLLHRPNRLSGGPVEDEDVALLGDLYHSVDGSASVADRDQGRLSGHVVIPHIVMHNLEVPHPLAGARVQRQHAVGEQVGALAVACPEVERGRAQAGVDDAALGIDTHASPAVRATRDFPGIPGPGLVSELSGPWRSVEDPAALAGPGV